MQSAASCEKFVCVWGDLFEQRRLGGGLRDRCEHGEHLSGERRAGHETSAEHGSYGGDLQAHKKCQQFYAEWLDAYAL